MKINLEVEITPTERLPFLVAAGDIIIQDSDMVIGRYQYGVDNMAVSFQGYMVNISTIDVCQAIDTAVEMRDRARLAEKEQTDEQT